MKNVFLVLVLALLPEISSAQVQVIAAKTWVPSYAGHAAVETARKCTISANVVEDTMWGPINPANGQRPTKKVNHRTLYSPGVVASAPQALGMIKQSQQFGAAGRPGIVDLAKITYFGFLPVPKSEAISVMLKTQQLGVGAGWQVNSSPSTTFLLQFIDKNCP